MLEARGITVVFDCDGAQVPVLQQVDLRVLPGELVAVVGANGSGKTTLGRALCGKQRLAGGQVLADGHDAAAGEQELAAVRRLVGAVGQHPADQIVAARVYDEVAFGPRNLGVPEDAVATRVAEALGACGLEGFEGRLTSELSGGEEQRLALAGVLAMRPRYLVLDEPTAYLDAALRPQVRRLMRELARERGMGVVLVTHDALEAQLADELLVLEAGAVRWRGEPEALRLGAPELWRCVLVEDGARGVKDDAARGAARGVEHGALGCAGRRERSVSAHADGRGAVSAAKSAAGADAMAGSAALLTLNATDAETASGAAASPADMFPLGALGAAAVSGAASDSGAGRARSAVPAFSAPCAAGLRLEGVSFSYGERRVLEGLDLEARPGRVLLVSGPSGAGKSTAAAVAAGLLQPECGRATLGGEPVVPGRVGLAFQNPEQQFFLETVYDEVAFAPRNLGLGEEEVAERVERALEVARLAPELAARDPFALSGGQARRVAVASVLSLEARAYIFDEPTAGLDVEGRRSMHQLACRLAQAGCAVVVISHDVEEWQAVADDAVELAPPPTHPGVAGQPGESAAAARAPKRRTLLQATAALDARVKLVWLLAVTVALFCTSGPVALVCWAAVAAVGLAASGLSPARVGSALKPAAFALALVLCANLFRCDGSADLVLAGAVGLSAAGARAGVRAVLRICLLVAFALEMAATTTATELAWACVRLARPLVRFGVPVEQLGAALSMALRFVPLVGEEFQRIRLSQRARGVDFEAGPLLERARKWVAVFAPLIIGLFRRADRLAESMAARCYTGAAQVPPKRLERGEWAALAGGLLALFAIVIICRL